MVPQLELDGVHFRFYRESTLRADGEAAHVTYRRDSSEVQAQDLVAILRGGGPVPVTLRAPEGHGVASERTFVATGGVEARRQDDVARTARVRFDPGEGKDVLVRGDDPVTVTGKGYRLEGKSFTLDPATGEIVLSGGARLVAGRGRKR